MEGIQDEDEDKNLKTEVKFDEKNSETESKSERRPQNEETVSYTQVEAVEIIYEGAEGSVSDSEAKVDERICETEAKSEKMVGKEDVDLEVEEKTYETEFKSEELIQNEEIVTDVDEKNCNTEENFETSANMENVVLEMEEKFFENEPKSEELIQNEDMTTTYVDEKNCHTEEKSSTSADPNVEDIDLVKDVDQKSCNTEEKSATSSDIVPKVDVKIDEQLSDSESTTDTDVNMEVDDQTIESKSVEATENDDIIVLDVEVDDEMQNSETEALSEKTVQNVEIILDIDCQVEHAETEITVQIDELTEDQNSSEMLKMTFCFPQQSEVVCDSRLEESSPFDEETTSKELAIKDNDPEDKTVETWCTSTDQIENDSKSSTPEVKPLIGSPLCLDVDFQASENLKCDIPSVTNSSQSINCSEQSPKSEITIDTSDNDEPQIEYLETNTDSQTTICSEPTPRAQSREDLGTCGKINSTSSFEDKVQSDSNLEEGMAVDPADAVPSENKDSRSEMVDLESTTPETSSNFDGNGMGPTTTVINVHVNNEVISCIGKVTERKSGVDELIRQLDETQPTHKLRSLCKRGDLDELKEFLKMKVDLVSFRLKSPLLDRF